MVSHQLHGLRPIRRFRRFQRNELADLIGVTPASYTRFERGERRIYWDKVTTLADRLGVRTDDFREPLTDDEAAALCDQRDKAAIAAGTFRPDLWRAQAPAEPASAPPPPPQAAPAPPPPPVDSGEPDGVAAADMSDWNVA